MLIGCTQARYGARVSAVSLETDPASRRPVRVGPKAQENPDMTRIQPLVPTGLDRSRVLEVASCYGQTVATVSRSRGAIRSDAGIADTAKDEGARQAAARFTMRLATEYTIEDEVAVPIVQTTFKQYLQEATQDRLYVDLAPGGQLGVGGALAQKVRSGSLHAAQFSLANLAPYVPAVDAINIPYWCGDNQQFANLVASTAWAAEIDPRLEAQGFKVLFYYTEDARTIAVRRGADTTLVRMPADLRGVKIRIPGSKAMRQFYTLAGAVPVSVAWTDTLAAVTHATVDALDPAVTTLVAGGFQDALASVSLVSTVADAQIYACNLAWYTALPSGIQRGIRDASDRAMVASFARLSACRTYSLERLSNAGVRIYELTATELSRWIEAAGESLREWEPLKVELIGSVGRFDALKRAANTKARYTFAS